MISASGAVAHDIWSNIVRHGRDSEKEEVWVAKIAAVSIGAIAIAIAIIGGEGLNISFMVGLAFAVAASANFPALLLALTWRRFNTTGAVTGVLFGVISSSGARGDQPDRVAGARLRGRRAVLVLAREPGDHQHPARVHRCWLGTMLTSEPATAAKFDELYVRSETGLGAEVATGLTLTGGGGRRGTAAAATATIPRL